jgi:hypothetical protein
MAQGSVTRIFLQRLLNGSALSLGIARTVVHGTFLFATLITSYSALAELPVTILRPTGLMKLMPWSFYDRLLTPSAMLTLKGLMILSLLLGMLGYLTAFSTKLSLVLVVFYEGMVRSFGHYNHDEMIAVYFLVVLAFTPCGDSFSLDHWLRRKAPGPRSFKYGYPVLLMQLLMAWVYFSSALVKMRVAGMKYLSPDNLPVLAIFHSLDNLHDTAFRFAFWLPQIRELLPYAVGMVLVWELMFPVAVISRRARWWILGFGILFHAMTLFLMNIFFPYQLVMYLIFVDWDQVAARLSSPKLASV